MAIDRDTTLKNAEESLRAGRLDAAIEAYSRVVEDQPDDWNAANTLGDLYLRSGQPEQAVPLYRRIAVHLLDEGFYPKAGALFKKILKIAPTDDAAQLSLAEISTRQGKLADARTHYAAVEARRRQRGDAAGADEILMRLGELDPEDLAAGQPGGDLPLQVAAKAIADGHIDAAREAFDQALRAGMDPSAVLEIGGRLLDSNPQHATAWGEAAADTYARAGAYREAATVLRELARRAPERLPLLLRLVEVCVDGGLEAEMFEAQAQLTDAYLAAGQAADARSIAEDLVARDPADAQHAARLRRAREMLGVEPAPAARPHTPPVPSTVASKQGSEPATVEIDLTSVLLELQQPSASPPAPAAPPRSLETVFAGLRVEAEAADAADTDAEHLGLARTYLEMGQPDEAARSLEVAARSPRHRFVASAMLAQLHRDSSDLGRAIEWFERAAEAPAPTPEDGRALLYDLGDVLETVGEAARALAVFLELQTDDPGYRDVRERVARLSRVETEG